MTRGFLQKEQINQSAAALAIWGIGLGLVLWGSGADWVIQSWLAAHYSPLMDVTTRTLGELGLGRTLLWVCFFIGLYRCVEGRWERIGGLVKDFLTGTVQQLMRWLRRRPGWATDWQGLDETGRLCWLAVPVLAVTGVVQLLLKGLVGRPRPREVLWSHVSPYHLEPLWRTGKFDAHYLSFPSGHSCSTWAVAVVLIAAFPRHRWVIVGLAVVASAARFLALTPHFIGDVVAGAGVGSAIGLVLLGLVQRGGGAAKVEKSRGGGLAQGRRGL